MLNTQDNRWPKVSRERPCLECGKTDGCTQTPDNERGHCWRTGKSWHRLDPNKQKTRPVRTSGRDKPKATMTPKVYTNSYDAAMDLLASVRRKYPTAQTPKIYSYKNHETGKTLMSVVRIDYIAPDGNREKQVRPFRYIGDTVVMGDPEAPLPLYQPQRLPADGTIYVVEGEKAADAAAGIGLPAVTSAHGAASAGKSDWTLLKNRDVALLPDRDEPGERYARDVAGILGGLGCRTKIVRLTLTDGSTPPPGFDIADLAELPDFTYLEQVRHYVENAVEQVPWSEPTTAGSTDDTDDKQPQDQARPRSQADDLVSIVDARFRLTRSAEGEPFAIRHEQPGLAHPLRGSSAALRPLLSAEYRKRHGKVASSTAIADAMVAVEGAALDLPPEQIHLRVAEHGESIVVDLGDPTGRAVHVDADGWRVVESSPVLFKRSELTGALPTPIIGGSVEPLKDLLNVTEQTWPMVLGWLVAAHFPCIAHPIGLIGGPAGSGKTTAARMMIDLIDPSRGGLRTQPRDDHQWAVTASSSYAFGIDNISSIPHWWSDALCKAVTGDSYVARRLYTDSGLHIMQFRRCILLTSIDPGALQSDLADRLIALDLLPIPATARRSETEILRRFEDLKASIFGGIMDLVAGTRRELPGVVLTEGPRMFDFSRILAAMDRAAPHLTGGVAFDIFGGQGVRMAEDVIFADAVAVAVVDLAKLSEEWHGTPTELLQRLTPMDKPFDWPKSPARLTGILKRLQPKLAQVGVMLDFGREAHSRTIRIRRVVIESSQAS